MKIIRSVSILAVVSLTGCASNAQRSKPEEDLLLQVRAKYKNMKSFAATLNTTDPNKSRPYTDNVKIELKRPDKMHVHSESTRLSETEKNPDGSHKTQCASYDTYMTGRIFSFDAQMGAAMLTFLDPEKVLTTLFFGTDSLFTNGMNGQKQSAYQTGQVTLSHKTLNNEIRGGISYRVIEISVAIQQQKETTRHTILLCIGTDTLIHWIIIRNPKAHDRLPHTQTDTQVTTRINPVLPDSAFDSPPDAKTK